jgi:hypothetical protein
MLSVYTRADQTFTKRGAVKILIAEIVPAQTKTKQLFYAVRSCSELKILNLAP